MTATYNTDNTLTELPGPKPDRNDYFDAGAFDESPTFDIQKYNKALEEYGKSLRSLRTLPCSPECRGLWKPGQVLTEGVDYEVKGAGEWKWASQLKWNVFAAPVAAVKSEQSEEKTFTLSELKEIIRGRMYTTENGRQPREGCNVLFYNLIYFLEHGEEDLDS